MRHKLTVRFLKELKPAEKPIEVFDTEQRGFFLRVQPTGRMTYYVAYRNGEGRQRRFRIGPTTTFSPEQARDIAKERLGEVIKGKDVHAERVERRRTAEQARIKTLKIFLDEHYAPWVEQHHSQNTATVARIRAAFPDLLDAPMSELSTWQLEKWRTHRLKIGRAVGTINRDVSALKGALSRAAEWGVIETNPIAAIKPLKTDRLPKQRFLDMNEARRLRAALVARDEEIKQARERANAWRRQRGYPEWESLRGARFADHVTPLVLVSLNTGIRQSAAFRLRWMNVDLKGRMFTIRGEFTKSSQTRHIPLNDEATEALTAWRNQTAGNDLVWPGRTGGPLNNVKRAWQRVLKSAEIHDFRWHDLRHTFASWLVMRGVPLNTVRDLLGHGDIKTTLRYAHLAPDHRAEAVSLLDQDPLAAKSKSW